VDVTKLQAYLNGICTCLLSETGNWQADVDFQSRKSRHTFHRTSDSSWVRMTNPQVFTCSFN